MLGEGRRDGWSGARSTLNRGTPHHIGQAQKLGLALGSGMSERLKRGAPAAADEEQALRALLSHSDGARGFYVTTLTAPELQNVRIERASASGLCATCLVGPRTTLTSVSIRP